MKLCRLVALGVLAFSLLITPGADARRRATPSERAAIIKAAHGRISCKGYPAGSCVVKVRVSTARRGWAAAYVRPVQPGSNTVQSDVASFRRVNGRWRLHQVGNGGGCSVPRSVVKDLALACY